MHISHFRRVSLLSASLAVLFNGSLWAQSAPAAPEQAASQNLSPDNLDQLLAPIALYPDALVGLILPASTVPSDVVLGDRFVQGNGDPAQAANESWDDSVKALVRYPDVLGWMDQNLSWTTAVGEAFVSQPADVMNSIQRLRAQAQAKGNLVNTPQQTIVQQDDDIRIEPTDPDMIYVPDYDPNVVYTQVYSSDYAPYVTFGAGCAVGAWLAYDFDWGNHRFYRGNWRGWNNHGNWNGHGGSNVVYISNNTAWQPSARSRQQVQQIQRHNGGNARFASTRQNPANVTASSARVASASGLPRPTRLNAAQGNGAAHAQAIRSQAPETANRAPTAESVNRAGEGRVPHVTTEAPRVSDEHSSAVENNRAAHVSNAPQHVNAQTGATLEPFERHAAQPSSRSVEPSRPMTTSEAPHVTQHAVSTEAPRVSQHAISTEAPHVSQPHISMPSAENQARPAEISHASAPAAHEAHAASVSAPSSGSDKKDGK